MAYLPFLRECSPHYQALPDSDDITTKLLGIPKPKFKVGDRIKYSFICDDKIDIESYGKTITLYGIVAWMLPDIKNKQWEYCILWDGQSVEHLEIYLSGDTHDYVELA